MPYHRDLLPQLTGDLFLTDGGLETTLVFHEGVELPYFAAYPLLEDERGIELLGAYYRGYITLARERGLGIVLDTPTWRASADWGARLGHDAAALRRLNRRAVELLVELRAEQPAGGPPVVVAGCIGPRGDGYRPDARTSVDEAERYHSEQVRAFAASEADLVSALTMNTVQEATGVARAAHAAEIPLALSFTVETDGRLPDGRPLGEAIEAVDAATGAAPAYYMLNCAHPTHFAEALLEGGDWTRRVRGIRANASRASHAELDEATELDVGVPAELGRELAALRARLPQLGVLGGCCGTDQRHLACIASTPRARRDDDVPEAHASAESSSARPAARRRR